MKRIILPSVIFISTFVSTLAQAQADKLPADSVGFAGTTETIVIGEKRLPGTIPSFSSRNIEIITAQSIQQLPVKTLNEVLTYVAGVDLRQRGVMGAQADLSMNGSGFEECLVLVNGIPMRDPQTGHHMLNLPIDLNSIERIEIYKGTAGRLFGSNALAGAINIVTKDPKAGSAWFESFTAIGQPQTAGDSYNTIGVNGSVGFGKKNASHSLSGGLLSSTGYRYNSANDQQRLNYMGNYKLGTQSSLQVMAGTFKNTFGANGYYAYPYDTDAEETVHTSFASAKAKIVTATGWLIRPQVYYRYNEDHYVFIKSKPTYYQNFHYSTAAGAEIHASKSNRFGAMGFGLEGRTELIRSTNLGDHNREYFNAYAEQRVELDDKSNLTVGVNAQYNSINGVTFFPGIEVNRRVGKMVNLYANTGLGNRLPSYTELYYHDAGNTSNDSLKAENAVYAELGFRKSGKFKFTANGFYRNVTNAINYTKASITDKWTPSNFANVTYMGMDIRLVYPFCNRASLMASYTYLDANISVSNDYLNKYGLDHARHNVSAQLLTQVTKQVSLTLSGRFVERYIGTNYTVCDARLNWKLTDTMNFNIDVTNLLNRNYIDRGYIPMPGRWFRVGLQFRM